MKRWIISLTLLLMAAVSLPAAIQYAGGTNVNTTFVTTTGTRAEVVAGLEAALTTAGWSTISGGGTGNVLMESATTPQSLKCRVRINDPGSGAAAEIYMRDAAGSHIQATPMWFRSTAGETVRVIANRYQFIMKTDGASDKGKFVMGGVPWIPSFIAATEIIYGQGNSTSAGETGASNCDFNHRLATDGGQGCHQYNNYGGTVWEINANTSGQIAGLQQFLVVHGAGFSTPVQTGVKWKDNSFFISDSILCWGDAAQTDEAKCVGQVWDAAVLSSPFAADTTISFDSKNWRAITSSNNGSTSLAQGTLFLVVP